LSVCTIKQEQYPANQHRCHWQNHYARIYLYPQIPQNHLVLDYEEKYRKENYDYAEKFPEALDIYRNRRESRDDGKNNDEYRKNERAYRHIYGFWHETIHLPVKIPVASHLFRHLRIKISADAAENEKYPYAGQLGFCNSHFAPSFQLI
jgi:hypothetical protein